MTKTSAVPSYSDFDFAQEVRTERLTLLWQVTFGSAVALFFVMIFVGIVASTEVSLWVEASLMIGLGSLLTRYSLQKDKYAWGVWSYAGGITMAIVLLLYTEPGPMRDTVPYAFSLLVFVVGLLLPPRVLPRLLLIVLVVTLGVPALYDGGFYPLNVTHHQWAALVLTLIGALWTVQITGELYAIAEWALSSYRRERERKLELHNSQLELKKTLARAQVLAENLEQTNDELGQTNQTLAVTNVELDKARQTAEEAKTFRGQFLANMSHELRTPLNAVIGFSETMLSFPEMYDDIPLPNEYQRDLEQINTSGAQLLHVINDILDLSKVDVGKLDVQQEKVNLQPIFNATLTTATGLIGDKPVRLLKDLPAELPPVWADPNRVRQILLNLYSNAAKFTRQGTITLGMTVQDDQVIIGVADTGDGIHADERELIFEEFRQGRASGSTQHAGSGLGLSISRHLVRLMNGRIWVESEVGVGSTFYFSLLRADKAEASTPEAAAITAEVPTSAVVMPTPADVTMSVAPQVNTQEEDKPIQAPVPSTTVTDEASALA